MFQAFLELDKDRSGKAGEVAGKEVTSTNGGFHKWIPQIDGFFRENFLMKVWMMTGGIPDISLFEDSSI